MEDGFDEIIYVALNEEIKENIRLQLKEARLDKEKRVKLSGVTDFQAVGNKLEKI